MPGVEVADEAEPRPSQADDGEVIGPRTEADQLIASATAVTPTLAQHPDLDRRGRENDLKLRKLIGYGALGMMALQIVVADAVFVLYGFTNHWDIPVTAIQAWLAATVIEVVAVVLAVTRSMFPSK